MSRESLLFFLLFIYNTAEILDTIDEKENKNSNMILFFFQIYENNKKKQKNIIELE